MHEANINTKTSEVGKKDGSLPSNYMGRIATSVGAQLVHRSEALDHATPYDWRTTQTAFPRALEFGPQPPLRYEGGTLGLCDDTPDVYCCTPGGPIFTTDIEDVLRNIDLFAEPDRSRLLFTAGMHFGLDPWLMVDRNYQSQEAQRLGEQP